MNPSASPRWALAAAMHLIILILTAVTAPAQEPAAAPYTPRVLPASGEAELTLHAIRTPLGLQVELFAAEPLLANPVAFCVDERGRFYVAETFRIEAGVTDTRKHMGWLDDDMASRTVEDRVAMYRKHLGDVSKTFTAEHERVRRLEDLDGDGKADASTVFADGFNTIADGIGAGVLARGKDVWFTCIPHLWLLGDEDGDGKADSRKSLHYGYGVHVGYYGHDLHGLRFGPDGKLYFSIGDRGLRVELGGGIIDYPDTGVVLRCEPDGSELEVFATGLRNPQELAFNELGDLFTGDNNSDGGDRARIVHVLEGGDSGWRIGYQFINSPVSRGPWNAEKLWHPRWDGQAAYIIPPIANLADGPSGLCYFPGTGLPASYAGRFFLCDFRGVNATSGVRSFTLEPRGASYAMKSDDQFVWSVLATDADFGPDGALYVSDWVEGWETTGKGRIYRVFDPVLARDPKTLEVKRLLAEGCGRRGVSELAALLGHADQRVRQEAQFALAMRGLDAIPALSEAAAGGGSLLARLHAVWALGRIGRREPKALESLLPLLGDRQPEVRAQAAKTLGDARDGLAFEGLTALLQDPEPRCGYFAAQGLGKLADPRAVGAVLRFLERVADSDPALRHAGVMALTGIEDDAAMLETAPEAPAAVRRGIVLALRRLESPEIASFLADRDAGIVLEAARAIYDVPIDGAMARLAALPIQPGDPAPLILRTLGANFRLGKAEHSERVASWAAHAAAPAETRVEALEQLGDWQSPSGRDRVLGLWRPVGPRPSGVPRAALAKALPAILAGAPDPVRIAAVKAAARLDLRDASSMLLDLALGAAASGGARAEAIKAAADLGEPRLLEGARKAASDPEAAVRVEARRILARLAPAEAVPILEAAFADGTRVERQAAVAALAGIEGPAAADVIAGWLEKLLAGQAQPEVLLEIIEAVEKRGTAPMKDKLARFRAAAGDDPVASRRESLAGGSAGDGRRIFHEKETVSCLRCHKAEGKGGEAGPNLAGIGSRETRENLLESLVAPNRKITKGFETTALVTREGRVHVGILKDEDEKHIRLTSAESQLLTIPKEDVLERSSGVSAMPEDVIKYLTPRELRDLVEYLAGLKG